MELKRPGKMSEGRWCQVQLPSSRTLELLVQPKLLAKELLDLVASHLSLKEKEFFGINFLDELNLCQWLQLDRRVLEHDFPRHPASLLLRFAVRFYIESIKYLKDSTTIELFYLNAKSCVYEGQIEVNNDLAFKLAAYALQEAKGDYTSVVPMSDLDMQSLIPTNTLKDHPSLAICKSLIVNYYQDLNGLTRGQAIVGYMSVVEESPTYGLHFYHVKDKEDVPLWLGVCWRGICQYEHQDRKKPRQVFDWKDLENLYFREKKFSIEVRDHHRPSGPRRSFSSSGVVVHTWYAKPALIKAIWAMAISQHQFYLDRKQSLAKIQAVRGQAEIAVDLDQAAALNISRLASVGSKARLSSRDSLSSLNSSDLGGEDDPMVKQEAMDTLCSKRDELMRQLVRCQEELQQLCAREAELTGRLPLHSKDKVLGTPRTSPHRVGATFALDKNKLHGSGQTECERLEQALAVQEQIVCAARQRASEPGLARTPRRHRQAELNAELVRLQKLQEEFDGWREKDNSTPNHLLSSPLLHDRLAKRRPSLPVKTSATSLFGQGKQNQTSNASFSPLSLGRGVQRLFSTVSRNSPDRSASHTSTPDQFIPKEAGNKRFHTAPSTPNPSHSLLTVNGSENPSHVRRSSASGNCGSPDPATWRDAAETSGRTMVSAFSSLSQHQIPAVPRCGNTPVYSYTLGRVGSVRDAPRSRLSLAVSGSVPDLKTPPSSQGSTETGDNPTHAKKSGTSSRLRPEWQRNKEPATLQPCDAYVRTLTHTGSFRNKVFNSNTSISTPGSSVTKLPGVSRSTPTRGLGRPPIHNGPSPRTRCTSPAQDGGRSTAGRRSRGGEGTTIKIVRVPSEREVAQDGLRKWYERRQQTGPETERALPPLCPLGQEPPHRRAQRQLSEPAGWDMDQRRGNVLFASQVRSSAQGQPQESRPVPPTRRFRSPATSPAKREDRTDNVRSPKTRAPYPGTLV
uniref:FERM domain-containing protein 4A-like isoform X2 n=1 Tax=Myxine glutinosa TaxID=7769 RepID=UPI00358E4C89